MPPIQLNKFQEILPPSVILRSKVFVSVLMALIPGILPRFALLAVFANFLQNTESFEPKKVSHVY